MKAVSSFIPLLFAAVGVVAQSSYDVVETPKLLGEQWEDSYTIVLLSSGDALVRPQFDSLLVASGGTADGGAPEGITRFRDVRIPGVHGGPVSVYYRTYEEGFTQDTHLTVWLEQGGGYLSARQDPTLVDPLHHFLIGFSFRMDAFLKRYIDNEDEQIGEDVFGPGSN